MNDDTNAVPIENVHFEKRTDTLPAELVDRITLIHAVFNPYLSASLEETIENFKYDQTPEREISIWEHMAQVVITLQNTTDWPPEKMMAAVKVVLGLSMGAVHDNTLDSMDAQRVTELWNDRRAR